jgi:hypothetical protein
MDRDLDSVFELIREDVRVRYLNKDSYTNSHIFRELIVDKHKLITCPDEHKLVNKLEKKITNSSILKSHKFTRQICILLLASSGYAVNSSIFNDVSDIFIEKCWDCIQYVLFNINNPTKSWLADVIQGRNPSSFSALFCPPRQLPQRTPVGSLFEDKFKSIECVSISSIDVPLTVWHRDDIVMQTILVHMKSNFRSS